MVPGPSVAVVCQRIATMGGGERPLLPSPLAGECRGHRPRGEGCCAKEPRRGSDPSPGLFAPLTNHPLPQGERVEDLRRGGFLREGEAPAEPRAPARREPRPPENQLPRQGFRHSPARGEGINRPGHTTDACNPLGTPGSILLARRAHEPKDHFLEVNSIRRTVFRSFATSTRLTVAVAGTSLYSHRLPSK